MINYIRSCFCKHNWEFLKEVHVNNNNDDIVHAYQFYRCNKCGHVQKNKTKVKEVNNTMNDLKCPFCGGEIDERGGQCNYGKKIMVLDLKCKQCETIFKFKSKWTENPYREAVEAFNRRKEGAG